MKRRIIQLGGRTLLVSIPYQWASEHDITKGSEINITETPQGILLHTNESAPKKVVVHIDSKDVERLLRRTVLSGYTSGANEVIVSHKPSEMHSLQDITKEFIGFDIVSQDKNKTVFQDFSTRDEKNVQQVFQRALMILKTMISEGKDGLEQNDSKLFTTIQQLDVNLKRTARHALECANVYDELKKEIDKVPPTRTTLLTSQLASTLIDIQAHQLEMMDEVRRE